jgi:hypothetical protein
MVNPCPALLNTVALQVSIHPHLKLEHTKVTFARPRDF